MSDGNTVGAFEAKTHFSKLLERVGEGEQIIITKHGVPIAKLVPAVERDQAKIESAIKGLQEFQKKGLTLGGLSLRALREEGRR